ncbi:TetR/AcrR family transcriptional regulator [Sphingomonas sp. LaA6.9]|uniref:TetR/AcrR family transcriptional regulator n=1 Tax=Sphingomonas sp. LaA6.9 TaxID=2919914 RepID=UPI001F4F9AC8|nr:TetR/AcrR family transcriptional regulator [Sphingomonas sp. LaA6.9]MCJ8156574.1 TetR/AcrR family transcriptional regulator [Sphingomonas sp. LaA6.9]
MTNAAKTAAKRRYVERPDIRTKLLDSAEALIREEGYAAATARKIASRVKLKHQAIFYYFGSQDELLIEVFRRSAKTHRENLEVALNSPKPLSAMWDVIRDPEVTRFTLEFMALANHNEAIRNELASNAAEVRNLETEAVDRHLKQRGIDPKLSPQLVSILTNALGRLLVQEATLGIHTGHHEAEALVEGSLRSFEAMGDTVEGVSPIVAAISATEGTTY